MIIQRVVLCCAAIVASVPMAASADTMSVATFLSKAEALQAKGMMAMFSSDLGVLKAQIEAASSAYRAQPASRPPASCPPPKGQAKISSDDILSSFRQIPVEQRAKTTVNDAFAAFMVRRYPCK